MNLPNKEIIERAARIVYDVMQPTAQYTWPLLNERAGTEVWIKHENHGPVGAFKIRGGLVYFRHLREQNQLGGVIAATRGNHGQAVAFAARREGIPATVCVPQGNSVSKNRAIRSLGATLVEHGTISKRRGRKRAGGRMPRGCTTFLHSMSASWLEMPPTPMNCSRRWKASMWRTFRSAWGRESAGCARPAKRSAGRRKSWAWFRRRRRLTTILSWRGRRCRGRPARNWRMGWPSRCPILRHLRFSGSMWRAWLP